LIQLWVRQALVRSMTRMTPGADWPIRSILLEPPGYLDEEAPVIEQQIRWGSPDIGNNLKWR